MFQVIFVPMTFDDKYIMRYSSSFFYFAPPKPRVYANVSFSDKLIKCLTLTHSIPPAYCGLHAMETPRCVLVLLYRAHTGGARGIPHQADPGHGKVHLPGPARSRCGGMRKFL